MSVRTLLLSEDPTLDQYILKPIVQRIFDDIGRRARIDVYQPGRGRPRGVDQALNRDNLDRILDDYPHIHVFVLVIDRDCHPLREARARALMHERPNPLLVCLAVEEVETWMLALHRRELGVLWSEVRAECHPKERFAEPFLKARKWALELGKGATSRCGIWARNGRGCFRYAPRSRSWSASWTSLS